MKKERDKILMESLIRKIRDRYDAMRHEFPDEFCRSFIEDLETIFNYCRNGGFVQDKCKPSYERFRNEDFLNRIKDEVLMINRKRKELEKEMKEADSKKKQLSAEVEAIEEIQEDFED